jgi:hypothetical protein
MITKMRKRRTTIKMSNIRELQDNMSFKDSLNNAPRRKPGIFVDTEVIAGYGYHNPGRFGLSYLDEVIMPAQRNTTPISGVQQLFEMMFGVQGPITINTMYQAHGIGLPDEAAVPSFLIPENPVLNGPATLKESIYANGHLCQLFGLGITGTAENNITVHKVGYRETDIEMVVHTTDGDMDAIMLPFRYTESELDPNERQMYFGKKVDASTGKTGYYLKRFESFPEIKHIWRSSDIEGTKAIETVATDDTIWDQSRDDALKSLVEIHFTISSDDLKEYFNYKMDQPEAARFNTIALFSGRYSEVGKSDTDQFGDYTNVTLFSKLNIPTEPMSLTKDLEYIYRIYGS